MTFEWAFWWWAVGFWCGWFPAAWLEAMRWRRKASGFTRMESGGKLFRVTEEP